MRISLKLNARAAAELAGRMPTSPPTRSLLAAVETAGAALEPTHPGVEDLELGTWFHVDVDDERADEVVERLRALEAIEGAFVKPPDAPP